MDRGKKVDRKAYISKLLGATEDGGGDDYQKQTSSKKEEYFEFEGGKEFDSMGKLEEYAKEHPDPENLAKLADL